MSEKMLPPAGHQWCCQLLAKLNQQRKSGERCDSTINITGGLSFPAHSTLLAASSPVFNHALSARNDLNNLIQISLENVEASAVEIFLEFVYSGELCCDLTHLADLRVLAEEFNIPCLASAVDNRENKIKNLGTKKENTPPGLNKVNTFETNKSNDLTTELSEASFVAFLEDNDIIETELVSLTCEVVKDDVKDLQSTEQYDFNMQCSVGATRNKQDQNSIQKKKKAMNNKNKNVLLGNRPEPRALPKCQPNTLTNKLDDGLTTNTSQFRINNARKKNSTCKLGIKINSTDFAAGRMVHKKVTKSDDIFVKQEFHEDMIENVHMSDTGSTFPQYLEHDVKKELIEKSLPAEKTEQLFTCDICSMTFTKRPYMRRHRKTHTAANAAEKASVCSFCGKLCRDKYSLKIHECSHSGDRLHKCDQCSKSYVHHMDLKNHQIRHAGQKQFICKECGKEFWTKRILTRHQRLHPNLTKTSVMCTYCSKLCTTVTQLRIHERLHTGEKPYMCDICQSTFSTREQLKLHKRQHTGEKYECRHCKKTYSTKHYMTDHERSHTEGKSFMCDLCAKTFFNSHDLKRHLKNVHANVKQFSCSYCERKFVEKCSLEIHVRKHTGEKPFMCDSCDKRYTSSSALKRHAKCHTDKKLQ